MNITCKLYKLMCLWCMYRVHRQIYLDYKSLNLVLASYYFHLMKMKRELLFIFVEIFQHFICPSLIETNSFSHRKTVNFHNIKFIRFIQRKCSLIYCSEGIKQAQYISVFARVCAIQLCVVYSKKIKTCAKQMNVL